MDIGAYELQQPQVPTAADVSLSGRITDRYGRPISSVTVTVTDGGGFTRSSRTSSFGYYIIRGIPAGGSYIVSPSARAYTFTPRFVSLMDNLSGFNFSPDASRRGAPIKGLSVKSPSRLKEEYK